LFDGSVDPLDRQHADEERQHEGEHLSGGDVDEVTGEAVADQRGDLGQSAVGDALPRGLACHRQVDQSPDRVRQIAHSRAESEVHERRPASLAQAGQHHL